MKNKIKNGIFSAIVLGALLTGSASVAVPAFASGTAKVTILKYVGDNKATAASANNADFAMSATWNAENIGAGSGTYVLSENGFNGNSTPYQAVTSDMTRGADYSTMEVLNDTVGANCAANKPFALVGYTSGNSLWAAENATPTLTPPAFTRLMSDKFVIVWNKDCSQPSTPQNVYVTIDKFVSGQKATTTSAKNKTFHMSATWNSENLGSGTGQYTLGPSSTTPYQAKTVAMREGADYSTREILTGNDVGASCAEGKPFALNGYTTGNTYAEARAATTSRVMPTFTDIKRDKFVIVWNTDCDNDGEIGGEVTPSQGVLAVTSIDSIDTTATADGTFANGWKYVFNITAPSNEEDLAMKFSNWLRNGGSGMIPVANNMRISSAQANNGGATILLTAADTYSTPYLQMTGDLNPTMIGRQVQVTVEVAVPTGTPDGSYTTNYGVKTQ